MARLDAILLALVSGMEDLEREQIGEDSFVLAGRPTHPSEKKGRSTLAIWKGSGCCSWKTVTAFEIKRSRCVGAQTRGRRTFAPPVFRPWRRWRPRERALPCCPLFRWRWRTDVPSSRSGASPRPRLSEPWFSPGESIHRWARRCASSGRQSALLINDVPTVGRGTMKSPIETTAGLSARTGFRCRQAACRRNVSASLKTQTQL